MNEDAFARRFYADRAELESLGIQLTVDKPADGVAEQENYSLRPENFHLPAIEFTDAELARAADRAVAARRRVRLRRAAAPRAPADLLGPPEPAAARPSSARSRSASPPSAGGHELSAAPGEDRDGDLPPQDDHLRLLHDGARRGRRAQGRPLPPALPGRPVLPPRPLARARRAARVPPVAHPRQGRLRDEGRARLPAARPTSTRARTPTAPTGSSATPLGTAEIWRLRAHRLAGRAPLRPLRRGRARADDGGRSSSAPTTPTPRQLVAWVLRLGEHARVLGAARARGRGRTSASSCCRAPRRAASSWPAPVARASAPAPTAPSRRRERRAGARRRSAPSASPGWSRSPPSSSRPAARGAAARRPPSVCERLQISDAGAARGRQRAQRRQLRRRLLRALRRDRRRRARSRSTPSPTATTSPAPRACCPSRPRRWSPRST